MTRIVGVVLLVAMFCTPAWSAEPVGPREALLSWQAPIQNTDGSALTNLAGYLVYHGSSPSALTERVQVTAPVTQYRFTSLPNGTHYFAVSAYNTAGAESALSAVGSKSINVDTTPPDAPTQGSIERTNP